MEERRDSVTEYVCLGYTMCSHVLEAETSAARDVVLPKLCFRTSKKGEVRWVFFASIRREERRNPERKRRSAPRRIPVAYRYPLVPVGQGVSATLPTSMFHS